MSTVARGVYVMLECRTSVSRSEDHNIILSLVVDEMMLWLALDEKMVADD